MATIQEINSTIIRGEFTTEQLDSIIHAVKYARAQLGRQNRRSIAVGSTVQWTNTRTGQTEIGQVTKIMFKNIQVKTSRALWNVPASMLSMPEAV